MNSDSQHDDTAGKGKQDMPDCSLLFAFHNEQQLIESILGPWLSAPELNAEFIIFDDGSTDGSDAAISTLLDYHNLDGAFYFRNDLRRGTALCLNEAIREARSKTILVVDQPATPDTAIFKQVLQDLSRSQDAYTIPETNLSLNPSDLGRHLKRDRLPSSVNYLIRIDRIRPDRFFFNPFLQTGHSAELLMRAGASAHGREAASFFMLDRAEDTYSTVSPKDAAAVRFHASLIKTGASAERTEADSGDAELMYEKAFLLRSEGRIADALQQCDIILKEHPRHDDTIALKIDLLQRLKQFVKASELKHRQTQNRLKNAADLEQEESKPAEEADIPPSEADTEAEADEDTTLHESADQEADTGHELELEQTEPEQKKDSSSRAATGIQPTLFPEIDEDEEKTDDEIEVKEENEVKSSKEGGYATRPVTPKQKTEANDKSDEQAAPEPGYQEDDSEEEETADQPYERPTTFRNTIVIPVTGKVLHFVENCMITLHEHCNAANTELIVVDNVCIDDTYEYLQQLVDNHFFHIRVIKNRRNKGFGAAINQAIEKAEGTYICVLHNDTALESNLPDELSGILEQHPDTGLVGPVADKTYNEEQLADQQGDASGLKEVSWIDSFCMCFRKDDGFRFDESYGMAWFDDMDLSMQVHKAGKKVFVAQDVFLRHYLGGTTDSMGFGPETKLFHQNMKLYNKKWNIKAALPEIPEDAHALEEIFILGQIVHPHHPFDVHRDRIKSLLDPETETELRKHRGMDDETLICFIRAMMSIDNRSMLRHLEEQLSGPVDDATSMELVQYYFDRHIYSRCRKHLENINGEKDALHLLYELRIAWGEKDINLATELVNEILENFPALPEANRLAGEMHKLHGNKEEMETFFTLADQLDPIRYPWPEAEPEPAEESNA